MWMYLLMNMVIPLMWLNLQLMADSAYNWSLFFQTMPLFLVLWTQLNHVCRLPSQLLIGNSSLLIWMYSIKNQLSSLIDLHAPQQSRRVVNRPCIPWFNDEIRAAIRARRRAKHKWRATKSAIHLAVFKQKKNYATCTLLMNRPHCTYYCDFIHENSV